MSEALTVHDTGLIKKTAATTYASGEVLQLEDGRIGIVAGLQAIASGDVFGLYTLGVFALAAASAVLFDAGEDVYWDVSANTCIKSGSAEAGDFPVGTATAAKISGDLTVSVDINVVSGRSQLLYALLAAGTALSNSSAETIMASFSVPANSLKAGDVLDILGQVIATATDSTDTFRFRLRVGGVAGAIIADTGAIDLANDDSGVLRASLVIRTNGATGTMVAAGDGRLKTTSFHTILGSTAVDTTAAIVICLTGTESVAAAANSARADIFAVSKR